MKAAIVIRALVCAVFVLPAAAAHAQLDGTLFTQPDEREYLDYLRAEFLRSSAEAGFDVEETKIPEIPDAVAEAAPAGPVEFHFGGIMTRRDGSRSVWLNGRVLSESELPDGITVGGGERSTSLTIAHNGNIYVLRPGQSVNLTTGTVIENSQRRQPAPLAVAAPQEDTTIDETLSAEVTPAQSQSVDVAPAAGADAPKASGDIASEEPTAVDADAIVTAVNGLDDEEAEVLFQALEDRRLERSQTNETSEEAADNEAP